MAAPFERHLTRDGGLIQTGPEFYLLARLADPLERVTVVEFDSAGPSLADGKPTNLWLVENQRGVQFVVEAWQLSRIPPDELYRQLRAQRPPTRIPVANVRLAGSRRLT